MSEIAILLCTIVMAVFAVSRDAHSFDKDLVLPQVFGVKNFLLIAVVMISK